MRHMGTLGGLTSFFALRTGLWSEPPEAFASVGGDDVPPEHTTSASAGLSGMVRPPFLPFDAEFGRWMASPSVPSASVTMLHVKPAISFARSPAFTESRMITRSRSGYLEELSTCPRAALTWASERIFACLP